MLVVFDDLLFVEFCCYFLLVVCVYCFVFGCFEFDYVS